MVLALVDGNNLAFRNWGNKQLLKMPPVAKMTDHQCVDCYLQMRDAYMRGIARDFQVIQKRFKVSPKLAIVWDHPKSNLPRKAIYPQYKQARKTSLDPNVLALFNLFRSSLQDDLEQVSPLLNLSFEEGECDDAIAAIAQSHQPIEPVVILSSDGDYFQLLSDNCSIVRLKGLFYTERAFRASYKFSPKSYPFYQALVGDPSDGYKGVTGIGPVKGKEIIRTQDFGAHKQDPNFQISLALATLPFSAYPADDVYEYVVKCLEEFPLPDWENFWSLGRSLRSVLQRM